MGESYCIQSVATVSQDFSHTDLLLGLPIDPPSFSPKMRFLDIFVVLRLNLGQVSFNLVEIAFATQQPALLAT